MLQQIRTTRLRPAIVAGSLATNILALVLPLTILHVFDRVIPNRSFETLAIFAMALFVVALADFAVKAARSHILSVSGQQFVQGAHWIACTRLFHPGVDTRELNEDELQDQFASMFRVQKHFCGEMAIALFDIPFVGIFIAVIALISPTMGFGAALLSLASLGLVLFCRRRIIALSKDRQDRSRRQHSFLAETLERAEMIKALGIEADMHRRYERLMARNAEITHDLSGRINITQGLTGTISLVSPVVMAGLGSFLVIDERMSMGGLAAAILLTNRIIQPILKIEALIASERNVRPAIAEVEQLVNPPMLLEGTTPCTQIKAIELDDVSWRPDSGQTDVIDGVSLSLSRGDAISITGADGSGRSTLLSLIAGHLGPTGGRISVDGRPIEVFDPVDLSQRIAYLGADFTMLEGTLFENMTRFEPHRHRDRALELARELGIDRFISGLPRGFSTPVAARSAATLPKAVHDGALLVGGLVSTPDVVLFDEASLGLDHQIDAALIRLLSQLSPHVILILVTYRPSLRAIADRHFRLEEGRLVEGPLLLAKKTAVA